MKRHYTEIDIDPKALEKWRRELSARLAEGKSGHFTQRVHPTPPDPQPSRQNVTHHCTGLRAEVMRWDRHGLLSDAASDAILDGIDEIEALFTPSR